MTNPVRLHHVAVVVEDTQRALEYFVGRLSLSVIHSESLVQPSVRLTYLDLGNTYLQVVEPRHPKLPIAQDLRDRGEGLHHICFAVPDPIEAAERFADRDVGPPIAGSGMGRVSAFVPGPTHHGVRIECTEAIDTGQSVQRYRP